MPEYAAKKYQVSSRVNSSELSTTGNQVVTKKSLESVVRSATEDEDRSQNLSIFGLTEQDSEKLDSKVSDKFSDLNEKPRVSTSRIGVKRNDKTNDSACRQ